MQYQTDAEMPWKPWQLNLHRNLGFFLQQLQRLLTQQGPAFRKAMNWVDAFLRITHGEHSELYRFLRQTMAARRALLLLDGLDEGGTMRVDIERAHNLAHTDSITCPSNGPKLKSRADEHMS